MVDMNVTPLREAINEILNPSIRLRAARLLVQLPEKEFTGREIAGLLGVSHSNVQRALRVLVDDGFAFKKRIGRSDIFWANKDHFLFKGLRELFLIETQLPDRLAEDLRSELRDSAISVTIFGSYARGEADRRSDLDILVVAKDPSAIESRIGRLEADFLRRYGVPLSVRVVSVSDLRKRSIPSYVREAMEEGTLVLGSPLRKVITAAE